MRARIWLSFTIDIEDDVIAGAMTQEFKSHHYDFRTQQDVAEHIAVNLIQGARLDQLDGFADRKESEASILHDTIDVDESSIEDDA